MEVSGHTQSSRQDAFASEKGTERMKLFTSGFLRDTPPQPDLQVPCNWDESPTLPLLSRGELRYNLNSPMEGILKWRGDEEIFFDYLRSNIFFQTMHILFIQQIFLFNENTK